MTDYNKIGYAVQDLSVQNDREMCIMPIIFNWKDQNSWEVKNANVFLIYLSYLPSSKMHIQYEEVSVKQRQGSTTLKRPSVSHLLLISRWESSLIVLNLSFPACSAVKIIKPT